LTPSPLILAFDTSAPHVAAALVLGDKVLAQRDEAMNKGQAERLFPLLEELFRESNYAWSDLTAIGVGTGPGNFTGIRISVSAARGLALSLKIPAVGVSSFEAQAVGLSRSVTSIIDARRDQVYLQILTDKTASQPELISHDDAQMRTKGQTTIGPSSTVNAVAIAQIAADRYLDGDLKRPAPLYVRAPDASPPRDPAPVILP